MTSALQIWQQALLLQPSPEPRARSTPIPKLEGSRGQKQTIHPGKGIMGQAGRWVGHHGSTGDKTCRRGTGTGKCVLYWTNWVRQRAWREAGNNRPSNYRKVEWEADDGCREARWAQWQQLALSKEESWAGTVKTVLRPHGTVNTQGRSAPRSMQHKAALSCSAL